MQIKIPIPGRHGSHDLLAVSYHSSAVLPSYPLSCSCAYISEVARFLLANCVDLLLLLWLVQTLPGPVTDPSKLPKWNYDGSSTGQAPGEDSEVIL